MHVAGCPTVSVGLKTRDVPELLVFGVYWKANRDGVWYGQDAEMTVTAAVELD